MNLCVCVYVVLMSFQFRLKLYNNNNIIVVNNKSLCLNCASFKKGTTFLCYLW